MRGYIHSLQSLGTVDGPGVRTVVFLEGCPLRCVYCHNPDTWTCKEESLREADDVVAQISRFYPYIKDGGVTFSGGEPCAQAEFVFKMASMLKEKGLHIALDTCGDIYNDAVEKLLSEVDLVMLDIKMTTEESYAEYTGGSLAKTLCFLDRLEELGIDTWIRHVVVPSINDTKEDIERLAGLIKGYKCIKKVELLPFKKLCCEKYSSLGIPFPLENTPQMNEKELSKLQNYLNTKI